MSYYDKHREVSELVGLTISSITRDGDTVTIQTGDGRLFIIQHHQDCCENVRLVDSVIPDGVVGQKVVSASHNSDSPELSWYERVTGCSSWDSATRTDIKIELENGLVVHLVWLGESNGYYGEGVSFEELT